MDVILQRFNHGLTEGKFYKELSRESSHANGSLVVFVIVNTFILNCGLGEELVFLYFLPLPGGAIN